MKKYVVFGAGGYGKQALDIIGKESIMYFVDNDKKKHNSYIDELPVYFFENKIEECKKNCIIVAVSEVYLEEVVEQLKSVGICNYKLLVDIKREMALDRLKVSRNNLETYNKAINWIKMNSKDGESIISNSGLKKGYPEVTGYFIPTLIKWGYRDLAVSYAKWLCNIQKEDGSWYDTYDTAPYVFDTAQILKGLLAIRPIYPNVDTEIKKGLNWILSNVQEDGRLNTPSKYAWGNDESFCSELIHLYCLTPLVEASKIFDEPKYEEVAYKILKYYKTNYYEKIVNFSLLSHFYAYVMEGLLDLGEKEIVVEAMAKLEKLLDEKGVVPAYNDVEWVCSTGLFQLALVWFKLGNIEAGNKAFSYACKLQNETGGWYGSYLTSNSLGEDNTYFPSSEISWAVKYYLDALYYKNVAEFNEKSDTFLDEISTTDGRYKIIDDILNKISINSNKKLKILDLGCGKGRYVKKIQLNYPNNCFFAVDISSKVMEHINSADIQKCVGTLTNIPFKNDFFDFVFAVESLEHAIDIESAIKEITRVTKSGGKIVIIDKNSKELGRMMIDQYEQWFDIDAIKSQVQKYCTDVKTYQNISYDLIKNDSLFTAIEGTVK